MELNSVFFPHSIQSCWYSFVCSAKLSFSSPVLLGLGIFFLHWSDKKNRGIKFTILLSQWWASQARGPLPWSPQSPTERPSEPRRLAPPIHPTGTVRCRHFSPGAAVPARSTPTVTPLGGPPLAVRQRPRSVPAPRRCTPCPANGRYSRRPGGEGRRGTGRPLSALRGAFRFPRWEVAGAGRRGTGSRYVRRPGKGGNLVVWNLSLWNLFVSSLFKQILPCF